MIRRSTIRAVGVAATLGAAISLAGGALAASATLSSHASSTAVAAVAASHPAQNVDQNSEDTPGVSVSTAANSDTVGGAHQNHGGYVSCVARGGSDCTSTTPTLPSHGTVPTLPTQAQNGSVPTR